MLDVILPLLSRILVPLFILGMAGSTVVVAMTFFHDVYDFFAKDESVPASGNTK